jgi:hypothetical protein
MHRFRVWTTLTETAPAVNVKMSTQSLLALAACFCFPSLGLAQLVSSADERQLPGNYPLALEAPTELIDPATLTFVESNIIFDGGSYGALFRRADGRVVVLYFLHTGFWSKQAIEKRRQPIIVDLDRERKDDALLEVAAESPFEERLIELLNADLENAARSPKATRTLKRLRDTVQNRKPLAEVRKRFPKASQNLEAPDSE